MSELLMSRHERVLHLTLNRPQARNALNNALLTLLAEALEAAAADPGVSACVISGGQRFFAESIAADQEDADIECVPRFQNDPPQRLQGVQAHRVPAQGG